MIVPYTCVLSGCFHSGKEVFPGTRFRELRNKRRHLLCCVDDMTGMVETEGPHKSQYLFHVPVGGTFTVIRDDVTSLVTRTATKFIVIDTIAA